MVNSGDFKSEVKDNEHQDEESHKSEPDKVSSLVSGSINPSDVPEIVASDGDQGGSKSGQQTEGGELNKML